MSGSISEENIHRGALCLARALLEDPRIGGVLFEAQCESEMLDSASAPLATARESAAAVASATGAEPVLFPLGVPHSYALELALRLLRWGSTGTFPYDHRQFALAVSGTEIPLDRSALDGLEALRRALSSLSEVLKNTADEPRIKEAVDAVVASLDAQTALIVLGFRVTKASEIHRLPYRQSMAKAFSLLHKPPNKLTVGARALSKHCVRCESWWGDLKGSEEAKNGKALAKLNAMLDAAAWINIHTLPPKPLPTGGVDENAPRVRVFEIRIPEGYGLRFLADGSAFRGFLEPQIEGGHETRWRHD